MAKPRLLDLFCGAGGAATGYSRAGFDVVGVDIADQPNYPFEFHQADAMTFPLDGFDVIHASPPCQAYSTLRARRPDVDYPDLYAPIRDRLIEHGAPWIIENVPGAPYRSGVVLCGSMFGLKIRRHRNFETSFAVLLNLICDHKAQGQPWGIYGAGGSTGAQRGRKAPQREYGKLMGMEWAEPSEIVQAVPPAYTELLGEQIMQVLSDG